MIGIVYAGIAGVVISMQSLFNLRMSEKTSFWFTNTWVHGTGFLLSMILLWMLKDGSSIDKLTSVNKLYWLGGCMGAVIVFTVMKSVASLGPAYAIAILLASQLIATLAIETVGAFGAERIALSANRLIGIGVMIAGIVIFKLK
ncbi:DMT family transporter [Cohnella panacarvi]|uniref:DMT family transporter n=1 Tax=Cohnella panacarvi TaxID=400776 RepID=UPI00047AF80E|nr:DMT family transporter [Cohnella panacarvi]